MNKTIYLIILSFFFVDKTKSQDLYTFCDNKEEKNKTRTSNDNGKEKYLFSMEDGSLKYKTYTLIKNVSDTKEYFNGINNNIKDEKHNRIYDYIKDNFYLHNSYTDNENFKKKCHPYINTNKPNNLTSLYSDKDFRTFKPKGNQFKYRLNTSLNNHNVLNDRRRIDWYNAGYQGGKPIPDNFFHYIEMPPPQKLPEKNYENFASAIQQAVNLKSNFLNKNIVIQFQQGSYVFNQQIVLNIFNNHSYIILRGKGIKTGATNNNYTELIYNINPNATRPREGNHFININGSLVYPKKNEAPKIINYNPFKNQISLDKKINISDGKEWLLEILFTNGKWHKPPSECNSLPEQNEYVGLITPAKLIYNRTYQLEKDFSKTWNVFKDSTNIAKVYKFLPIKEIGLNNLSIRYSDSFQNIKKDDINSALISVNRAKNCWINNVEISKVLSLGIAIGQSFHSELRNSYIHEAYDYGGNGRAYGVVVGSRSVHCKIENNTFRKLRHAMQVSFGSNYNVFGYNYSREQTDQLGNSLSDLNLHGFYPYANLFEGNMVDRIHADNCFGPNGPYNTFFRNYTKYNQLKIDEMTDTNIIDNMNAYITINNKNTSLFSNSVIKQGYNYPHKASFYLHKTPEFFKEPAENKKVTWPAIGSPLLIHTPLLKDTILQNIPAKERWLNHLKNKID